MNVADSEHTSPQATDVPLNSKIVWADELDGKGKGKALRIPNPREREKGNNCACVSVERSCY